jgi:hypothetical protein
MPVGEGNKFDGLATSVACAKTPNKHRTKPVANAHRLKRRSNGFIVV